MSDVKARIMPNGSAIAIDDIPQGGLFWLRSVILEKVAGGSHLSAFFPIRHNGKTFLVAILASPEEGGVAIGMAPVGDSYPSLTPECPEAHLFEREIYESWNITPKGHPWLKPVRFPADNPGRGPSVADFYRIEGDEIHEVAVGPVHAGVIEPGHFRFQCRGEEVLHLEISLGYQHRGIEKALAGGPDALTLPMLETAAGDTTCGHALAYAMNIEALAGLEVSEEAHRVRAIALELERIANHTGDMGALAGDVGFLPTSSYCGRLRGDILNLTGLICGNRFGRGLIVPGGVSYGIALPMAGIARERLKTAARDIDGAVELMFQQPSVLGRFEGAGIVDRETAYRLGMVGPAARASNLEVDVRSDLPFGAYRDGETWPLRLGERGDVLDRARQRRVEVEDSVNFIAATLCADCNAREKSSKPPPALAGEMLAVSLVEGWRGMVCHVAATDLDGRFTAYKVVDSSFHNWTGLAMALRNQQISDFPLCNKSFNLSYCGHDL